MLEIQKALANFQWDKILDTDPKNAFKLASELDQFNKERQMLEKDLLQKLLNETKDYSKELFALLTLSLWSAQVHA